jgi:hypothetical protein
LRLRDASLGSKRAQTWAQSQLPKLVRRFWRGSVVMEEGLVQLRNAVSPAELDAGDKTALEGFTRMTRILSRLELEAPSEVAHKAAVYMDTLDHIRMTLLDTEDRGSRHTIYWASVIRVGASEEFKNACRRAMGLDSHSTAGLNRERVRALSVHPRLRRRHDRALARLHRAQRTGSRWWRR